MKKSMAMGEIPFYIVLAIPFSFCLQIKSIQYGGGK